MGDGGEGTGEGKAGGVEEGKWRGVGGGEAGKVN